MTVIPWNRVKEILAAIQEQRILVIGDIMLDQYCWGTVNRISPEAPVPVVDIGSESIRLGGAANVANNIRSLGAEPWLVGVIGNDGYGRRFLDEMKIHHMSTDGIIIDESRPTTIKTRIIAHHQQVLRTDRESKKRISKKIEQQTIDVIRRLAHKADALLIQDYNKGTITKDLIKQVTGLAQQYRKILAVDPKFDHFFSFGGATVFKPNQREVENALGFKIEDERQLQKAGEKILKRLQCSYLLITRGEQGMALFDRKGKVTHIPTRAKEVYDVSGAGDTAIGVLTVAHAAGASITEAATMANHASGIVCAELGIFPVVKEELSREMKLAVQERKESC
ncbi:MAG: D-glycero-beta-D-manno-heptose-7-phosphate kinase [Gemmatimonadota bacterium]|nr:MAG: D-glycero-beta-D-manno-heptose-7-phosphate kinase [Gemmatimonadota bacterium]